MELRQVYNRMLFVANHFLENASHLTLESLKEYDPSVDQISKNMRMLATILKDLAGDNYEDSNMAMNAFQCCLIMERLADAVASNNGDDLETIVKEFEIHVNVP